MKRILFILIMILAFANSQIRKDVQEIMGDVHDDTNNALQSNVVTHFAKDDSMDAVITLDPGHHRVHIGKSFLYTYMDSDFDNGDTIIVAFVTPNSTDQLHFVGSVGNSSAAAVYFCEAPTIAATKGTNVNTYNRNRASTNASLVLSSKDSTATKLTLITAGDQSNNGTVLETYVIGSGKNKIAGATRDFNEWVLNEYVLYSLMVIGLANDGVLDLRIGYYENDPSE